MKDYLCSKYIGMCIIDWLESNFHTLVDFLGKDFIQSIFRPAEEFLASNPSEYEIFKYLDKECINTRFKNMVWRAYFNIGSSTAEIAKMELEILEDSIKILSAKIGESKLRAIRDKLQDPYNMWQGLHEVYVASHLCEISQDIELEVPNPDRPLNNFDIKANLYGIEINIEVTTRTDDCPPMDGNTHSRATVLPAFAGSVQSSTANIQHNSVPESEDLRRRLLDKAMRQLPKNGINIIALGYKGIANKNFHITSALYGDPKCEFDKSLSPEERTLFENRVENGLILEEGFKHISAVMLISPHNNDGTLYINPSDKRLPPSVQELLVKTFNLSGE
ncbi:MAG: hypothetical protein ACRENW_01900 [Thermodesulfobacteriota bacterium]